MSLARHVAWEVKGAHTVLIRKHKGGINMDGRNLMEDLGKNGRIILALILRSRIGGRADWINLAQDKD
jgi:hypothetical protein